MSRNFVLRNENYPLHSTPDNIPLHTLENFRQVFIADCKYVRSNFPSPCIVLLK